MQKMAKCWPIICQMLADSAKCDSQIELKDLQQSDALEIKIKLDTITKLSFALEKTNIILNFILLIKNFHEMDKVEFSTNLAYLLMTIKSDDIIWNGELKFIVDTLYM